jgi:hypothetical protein
LRTARDDDGTGPLVLASSAGHVDVVHMLVRAGADVDERDPCEWQSCRSAASSQVYQAARAGERSEQQLIGIAQAAGLPSCGQRTARTLRLLPSSSRRAPMSRRAAPKARPARTSSSLLRPTTAHFPAPRSAFPGRAVVSDRPPAAAPLRCSVTTARSWLISCTSSCCASGERGSAARAITCAR